MTFRSIAYISDIVGTIDDLESTEPLHELMPPEMAGSYYYACAYPERPYSEFACYDWRCKACVRHAQAIVALNVDTGARWRLPLEGGADVFPLLLQRSLEYFGW